MQNRLSYDLRTARTFARDLAVASTALAVARISGTLASAPIFAIPFYAVLRSFLPPSSFETLAGRVVPLSLVGLVLGWCAGNGAQFSMSGAIVFLGAGVLTDLALVVALPRRPVRKGRVPTTADPEAWATLVRTAHRSPDFAVVTAPANAPATERQAA